MYTYGFTIIGDSFLLNIGQLYAKSKIYMVSLKGNITPSYKKINLSYVILFSFNILSNSINRHLH